MSGPGAERESLLLGLWCGCSWVWRRVTERLSLNKTSGFGKEPSLFSVSSKNGITCWGKLPRSGTFGGDASTERAPVKKTGTGWRQEDGNGDLSSSASQKVPAVASRLEVLLHTPVVLDLGGDRNGHGLTACKSNRPGPRRREEVGIFRYPFM